jgi:hypothetical protein
MDACTLSDSSMQNSYSSELPLKWNRVAWYVQGSLAA